MGSSGRTSTCPGDEVGSAPEALGATATTTAGSAGADCPGTFGPSGTAAMTGAGSAAAANTGGRGSEGVAACSAGAAIAGAAAWMDSSFLGPAYSGGSSRKVYSRTSRPFTQFSSTSMSTKGSLMGWVEVSAMTYCPLGRRWTANLSDSSAGLRSTLAWRKTSDGASRAPRVSPSPRCKETISISALSGCPSAERTDSLPKPAAQASEGKIRLTTATKQVFEANFPTCHPEPKWKQIKIPSWP